MIPLYQEDPLYLAIMHNDKPRIKKLKESGAVLTEHIITVLTCPVGGAAKAGVHTIAWYSHIENIRTMKVQKLTEVLRQLREELGQPMYFSSAYGWEHQKRFYEEPELFLCVLDCFDNRKIQKSVVWDNIIDNDKTELLAAAVERGWLKTAKKRDELIQYANENNKTECLAWLLDYKDKTADLAEERKRAEKKLQRELNANPDSITEIKKRWGYKQQEDGTLVITSCKKGLGSSTVIAVPEKIGKDTVTAIGACAFSPRTSRITEQTRNFRSSITEVILPPTVKTIGKCAFDLCESLEKINIPEGLEEIGEMGFSVCKSLKEVYIPDSVSQMGDYAFSLSGIERITLPEGIERLSHTFNNCNYLKEITLPKNLKEIGRYTFNRCTPLKEIEIPRTVEILDAHSFAFCESLEKITLYGGIKKIGQYAFQYCKRLSEIVIPEGVEEIGACAFVSCFSLKKIYLPRSLKKIKNSSDGQSTVNFVYNIYNIANVTAAVYKGSYAEKYCKRNNIPYEIREEENDGE